MTENQLKELRDIMNYATTIPYAMLTRKDKAAYLLAHDLAWWGVQKMNGDFQMKESDKKLKAEGFNPSREDMTAAFKAFFKKELASNHVSPCLCPYGGFFSRSTELRKE